MPASLPSERLLNAIATLCPACRSKMTLAHVTRDLRGYAVQTLECPECPRLLKKVVKLGDPMKVRTSRPSRLGSRAKLIP
jgi:hypothetical protein